MNALMVTYAVLRKNGTWEPHMAEVPAYYKDSLQQWAEENITFEAEDVTGVFVLSCE